LRECCWQGLAHTQRLDLETGTVLPEIWDIVYLNSFLNVFPIQTAGWPMLPAAEPFPAFASMLCPKAAFLAIPTLLGKRYWGLCRDGSLIEGTVGEPPSRRLATGLSFQAISGVIAALISPDARYLVVGGTKGNLATLELETGKTWLAQTTTQDASGVVAVSKDSRLIATAGDRQTIEVRELPSLSLLVQIPSTITQDLLFLADGSLLVAEGNRLSQ
jgi:hypothetical protein